MIFVGLDLSFTETGAVCINESGQIVDKTLIKTDSKNTPEKRIIQIEHSIYKFTPVPPKMVYIEDKFVGRNKKQVLYDGGLLYHIVISMVKRNSPYKIINPTTLKSFVIGTKGKKKGSKKELMLLHCYKKWGVEFENNNLCDAYCLARMALEDMLEAKKSSGNVKRAKR